MLVAGWILLLLHTAELAAGQKSMEHRGQGQRPELAAGWILLYLPTAELAAGWKSKEHIGRLLHSKAVMQRMNYVVVVVNHVWRHTTR